MRLEYGGHLGLHAAVSGLPAAPMVADYGRVVARQREAGLRHIGEALVRPGGRLRVLDGLMVSGADRGGWVRVDRTELRRLQDAAAGSAGIRSLLTLLRTMEEQDRDGLRRVQIYQLVQLLQQGSLRPQAANAEALGLDPGECRALAHAARTGPRLTVSQRAAAETLPDVWARGEVRRAAALVRELELLTGRGPGPGPDPGYGPGSDRRLAGLMEQVRAADRSVDGMLRAGRDAEAAGAVELARGEYLRLVGLCVDEEQGVRGLVRTYRPPAEGEPELRAEAAADGVVRLSWGGPDPDAGWRVVRLAREEAGPASVAQLAASVTGGGFADHGPPLGRPVRYAVLPLEGGRISGPPLVSASLTVTQEVSGLGLVDGRESVRVSWSWPPGAPEAVVAWSGPDGLAGSRVVVGGGPTGDCVVAGLPPGGYRIRVSCRHGSPTRGYVESPGVHGRCTVLRWPEPVREFSAVPDEERGGFRFGWTGAVGAEVRLVVWPDGTAPVQGAELRQPPAPLDWPASPEDPAVLLPPRETGARVTAVAVLGELALVGPELTVQAVGPVSGLRVRRTGAGEADVLFDWPGTVGRVEVAWERESVPELRTVSRSTFLREGLRIEVGSPGSRVRVSPVPPAVAGSAVLLTGSAEVEVAPCLALSYRVARGRLRSMRRGWGRGHAVLRVELSAPAGAGSVVLPDFVLVAKPLGEDGGGGRPRHPDDGVTVLRLSGKQLLGAGPGEYRITPDGCSPPCTLRGFLVGDRAAEVRLDEPSPAELVVR
ncbi:hypothetical protein [Streptacidiphilus carbonis]|uniref:hypothetical protein n=1 Tax=Streptacidiphilus carbonis TaxID=105422 RepID=UPI0005AB85FC|nr:hypothetical protein [Streptacidiphilus carbonis]